MATCDACGTEVEPDALIESDGRRLCADCEFDADLGGGVGGGLLPVILGGIAAAIPLLLSISVTKVQASVGHFSQELTQTTVGLFSTSPPANAIWSVDMVALIGGVLATPCGIWWATRHVGNGKSEWGQAAAGGLIALLGVYHLWAGLRFLL